MSLKSWIFRLSLYMSILAYSVVQCNELCTVSLILLILARFYYIYHRSLTVPTEGRGVLVTGCDTGFGHQLAIDLHVLGFTVFACCLDDQSDGARKLRILGGDGGRLHVMKLDVTNQKEVDEALLYVKSHLPDLGLWGLVNNAGLSISGPVEWLRFEAFEKVLSVNLFGVIRMTKTFLPLIRRSQGRIVNIASVLGRVVYPWLSAYCVSKHGLEAFTDVLRLEMRRFNVKVATIEPGNFLLATNITTDRDLKIKQYWNQLSDDAQESLDEFLKHVKNQSDNSSRDVVPVVNRMKDALLRLHPKHRYMVADWKLKAFIYFYHSVPTAISNLLIK